MRVGLNFILGVRFLHASLGRKVRRLWSHGPYDLSRVTCSTLAPLLVLCASQVIGPGELGWSRSSRFRPIPRYYSRALLVSLIVLW